MRHPQPRNQVPARITGHPNHPEITGRRCWPLAPRNRLCRYLAVHPPSQPGATRCLGPRTLGNRKWPPLAQGRPLARRQITDPHRKFNTCDGDPAQHRDHVAQSRRPHKHRQSHPEIQEPPRSDARNRWVLLELATLQTPCSEGSSVLAAWPLGCCMLDTL